MKVEREPLRNEISSDALVGQDKPAIDPGNAPRTEVPPIDAMGEAGQLRQGAAAAFAHRLETRAAKSGAVDVRALLRRGRDAEIHEATQMLLAGATGNKAQQVYGQLDRLEDLLGGGFPKVTGRAEYHQALCRAVNDLPLEERTRVADLLVRESARFQQERSPKLGNTREGYPEAELGIGRTPTGDLLLLPKQILGLASEAGMPLSPHMAWAYGGGNAKPVRLATVDETGQPQILWFKTSVPELVRLEKNTVATLQLFGVPTLTIVDGPSLPPERLVTVHEPAIDFTDFTTGLLCREEPLEAVEVQRLAWATGEYGIITAYFLGDGDRFQNQLLTADGDVRQHDFELMEHLVNAKAFHDLIDNMSITMFTTSELGKDPQTDRLDEFNALFLQAFNEGVRRGWDRLQRVLADPDKTARLRELLLERAGLGGRTIQLPSEIFGMRRVTLRHLAADGTPPEQLLEALLRPGGVQPFELEVIGEILRIPPRG